MFSGYALINSEEISISCPSSKLNCFHLSTAVLVSCSSQEKVVNLIVSTVQCENIVIARLSNQNKSAELDLLFSIEQQPSFRLSYSSSSAYDDIEVHLSGYWTHDNTFESENEESNENVDEEIEDEDDGASERESAHSYTHDGSESNHDRNLLNRIPHPYDYFEEDKKQLEDFNETN